MNKLCLISLSLLLPCACVSEDAHWIYWLAGPEPDKIGEEEATTVVVDYSRTGLDAEAFSAADVTRMSRDGERPVLAYLSIGEAEDYRYYWEQSWDGDADGEPDADAPSWLGPVNPQWGGNYKVRFWDESWQAILLAEGGYLDRILDAGFDGVYLDIIDAYNYWAEAAPAGDQRPIEETADDMIALLERIASTAQQRDPDFMIVPQNGEFVGYDAGSGGMERLLATIAGFGVEDVFFPGDMEEDNPLAPDTDRLEVLDEVVEAGKFVLAVDYLTDESSARSFVEEATTHGFQTCVARRALDALPDEF